MARLYAANGSTVTTEAARTIKLGNEDANSLSTIEKDFEIKSCGGVITLIGSQKWDISSGATYKINAVAGTNTGGSITNSGSITQNGGTVDFNAASISGNGNYSITGNGALKNATFSSGTLKLGATATYSAVVMGAGSTLDISDHSLSSTDAMLVSDSITLTDGMSVKMSGVTNGTTVALYDQTLNSLTFYVDGKELSAGRSDISQINGVFTFNTIGFRYADMVWAGGEGTWNKTSTNWNSAMAGNGVSFADQDSVTFDSSAVVTVDGNQTVREMTVTGANTELLLKRSNNGCVTGAVTVTDGATMIIGSEVGSTGFVRGTIDVVNGVLQFDSKDVTGFGGGANSTSKITIANGSTLQLNHDSNETFAGELVLNGTVKGIKKTPAKWDFYGNSAKLKVEANQTAKFEDVTIRLRQDNTQIDVASGATLTTADVTNPGDYGNGTFIKKGDGEMIVGGTLNVVTAQVEDGTLSIRKGATLSTELRHLEGTVNVGTDTMDSVLLTTNRLELGDNNSSVSTAVLNISQGATVKVLGDKNGTEYDNVSLLLGEWEAKAEVNVDGALLASSAKALVGDSGMTINIKGTGTVAVKGIGIANVKSGEPQSTTIVLNDGGKLILGDGGIASNLKTPNITLNAGIIGSTAEAMTLGSAMTLSSSTGATIDTDLYAFAADGNTVSKSTTGETAAITISGVLSGAGKLVKDGAGTLTLSGTNTYTGGTTITKGKLIASHANALGTGKVVVNGGTLRAATGLTITELEQTSGSLEFASGTTTIKNGLDAVSVDLTGSTKLVLGVDGGGSKTKSFSIGSISGNQNLQVNEGTLTLGSTSATTHELGHLDLSSGNDSVAQVTLKSGATVTTNGQMWVNRTASVSLEDTASLKIGNVTIKGNGTTSATIQRNDESPDDQGADLYGSANQRFNICNADVEVTAAEAGTTISNRLIGVALTNKGTGTLTATNGYNGFTSIKAEKGNINITNFNRESNQTALTLSELMIAEGKKVGIYTDNSLPAEPSGNNEGTVTTQALTVGANATLNANLVLANGAKVTMAGALTMGSTLTLGTGMELNGALLTSVTDLTEGNTVDLFTGVDGLTLGSTSYDADTSLELGTETLSTYFGNVTNPDIYLGYDAATNVVYAGVMQAPVTPAIPEPTTATLSLLALAALAARRRR